MRAKIMIDDTTQISTAELCALCDLTKGRLSQLESAGVIQRSEKNSWPLIATTRALFADARSRSAAHSEAKGRMEEARAKALELKLSREEGKVAPVEDFYAAVTMIIGKITAALVALPARFTRDLLERQRLEALINELRTNVADWIQQESSRLEEAGRKSARQRS
jgi:phage terminase Nu1 subunit (DNA packaging protein)